MKIKIYAAVAALVVMPAPAAATPPGDWPQSGGGPGNTYYTPSGLPGPIDGVRQRWKLPAHGPSRCETGADPVVAAGRLVTTDPGGIGAYDPATGARRWHLDLPRTTVRRLAIADGRLLMLSSECALPARYESHLTAFDPATGRRLWHAGLAKFSYDMRIDRGTIALDSNQDGLASTIAYAVSDGRFRWLRRGDRGDGLISAGGRLLLRSNTGGAQGVSITDGHTLWQTDKSWYAVGSDPAGTRFYVAGPALSAIDAASGHVLWTSPLSAAEVTSDGARVYFARSRSIECLDATTGHKLWSIHLPRVADRPLRAGDLLFAIGKPAIPTTGAAPAANATTVLAANATTGAVLATIGPPAPTHLGSTHTSAPPDIPEIPETRVAAAANGRLFLTDGDQLSAYF